MGDVRFVWVFVRAPAEGDELRFSIESARRFFDGPSFDFLICGDRPLWHTDEPMIDIRRFPKTIARKWADCVRKLQRIIDDRRVADQFCWLYDDQFFVRPFSFVDLMKPRASKQIQPRVATSDWRRVQANTVAALSTAGLPAWDYNHHGPHVFDKQKMQETIDRFELHRRPLLPELLYENQHHLAPAESDFPFVQIVDRMSNATEGATVLNCPYWTGPNRAWIRERIGGG